jgi:hypothetical protein
MTNVRQTLAPRVGLAMATGVQLLMVSAILVAQDVNPRGVPPPRRNTPDYPERNLERESARRVGRVNIAAPDRRLILAQIKKDFLQIQVVNDELGQQLTADGALDYKHISDAAGKIKTLAGRLDSNLVLGKSEGKEPRPEYEFSEAGLRSSLLSLHDLVVRFVENPIFKESGVFDIQETKKAKEDVDSIIALGNQTKRIAKKLRKETSK